LNGLEAAAVLEGLVAEFREALMELPKEEIGSMLKDALSLREK